MEPSTRFIVVVGIDFSPLSDDALDTALRLPETEATELHLVHVLPIPPGERTPLPASTLREEATQKLEERVARARAARPALRIQAHLTIGNPGRRLAEVAEELGADHVVVGTHDRKGVSRWVRSSVAEVLTRHAPCSVTTVRTRPLRPEEKIEPPCPDCVARARASGGDEPWCARHAQRHHPRPRLHYEISEPFAVGSLTFRPDPRA
jgi:nucleotide-binding universal stress UspA family protein